jgi:hypothetical protein
MKPREPMLLSVRLTNQADQVRERLGYLYYNLSTENVYLYWVRFLFAGLACGIYAKLVCASWRRF